MPQLPMVKKTELRIARRKNAGGLELTYNSILESPLDSRNAQFDLDNLHRDYREAFARGDLERAKHLKSRILQLELGSTLEEIEDIKARENERAKLDSSWLQNLSVVAITSGVATPVGTLLFTPKELRPDVEVMVAGGATFFLLGVFLMVLARRRLRSIRA
jgi:VIT1/CCC1 family predicted Fe2+/Mn2+ transporter